MHTLITLLLFVPLTYSSPTSSPQYYLRELTTLRDAVDSFIATETPIALSNIRCNIGPAGKCVPGAHSGLVIAGPGKENPDYFYTWSRDSALTFKSLVDIFVNDYDPSLQALIEDYVTSQAYLQTLSNPSGDLSSGAGLGEPKFNADRTPFTASWGRPQRDGPALRATTMIAYSQWLIENGYSSTASETVWPIIRNDLSYIAQYWNETGFDLWEEVEGSSYFTISSQYRALVEGSTLAARLGKKCESCETQAPQILCFLQSFWDPHRGYMLANINDKSGRSAIDSNTILASIHQFDSAFGCDRLTMQPCSDLALSNHKIVTDSFRPVYAVNSEIPLGRAVSVGRYPEDVYYNGNPWYLATFAAAEQLYDAIYTWEKYQVINVTDISIGFFRDLIPTIRTGTYTEASSVYHQIIDATFSYADGFMQIAATYTPTNGSLSEQYEKRTGNPLSAYDLTWSYVAFISAAARRSKVVPRSWAPDLPINSIHQLPSVCIASPQKGTYLAAPSPTWPLNQTPIGYTPDPTNSFPTPAPTTPCNPQPTVLVTFSELAKTTYGDTIKISGSIPDLGNWNPELAVPLSADQYSANHPLWQGTITLDAGLSFEYRYINVKSNDTIQWEEGITHTFSVPTGCETAISVVNRWRMY